MTDPVKLNRCRISGSTELVPIISLGDQYLTGVFPSDDSKTVSCGPLELVWCPLSGLVQLGHSYNLDEMYGENYGYRSGLNSSMVSHLKRKVSELKKFLAPSLDQIVLDIGSNDGTLLSFYDSTEVVRVGIDPTAEKFVEHYEEDIKIIPDFFRASLFKELLGSKKAQIVTSISMFYDLENPGAFVADVAEILDENGVWHFEQSYLPSMLEANSYDTICHEHLEYYTLTVVKSVLDQQRLKIIDVDVNSVNGGSFSVTAAHERSIHIPNSEKISELLNREKELGLSTIEPLLRFRDRVFEHRNQLRDLIKSLNDAGKVVAGYGASTKGNVLLQFCGFSDREIQCIAEINPDKFGCKTPGTNIPIHPEETVFGLKPDYLLVLPWHFRSSILRREKKFRDRGGKFIFPLPNIEIV